MASARLPPPGPSYLKEQAVEVGTRRYRAGMSRPATSDEWWTAILWLADDDGLVPFTDIGPAAGPPPEPPLAHLGPALAGGLSGLILEDSGRLQVRLGPVIPPEDPERPWRAPVVIRAAFRWEPARAATLRESALATEVLTAFRRSIERLRKP